MRQHQLAVRVCDESKMEWVSMVEIVFALKPSEMDELQTER